MKRSAAGAPTLCCQPRGKMLLLLHLAAAALLAHSGYAFPEVSLTVSSLKRPLEGEGPHVFQREVELLWQPIPGAEWIGLFPNPPPKKTILEPVTLVRVKTADYPAAWYRTNISFPRQQFPNGWNKGSEEKTVPGDACMSFWIGAYTKTNELLHSDCIKIRPTWMGDHRSKLEILTLADLFIPGTHNSATYNRATMENTGETIGRYVLTQDTNVWGQLVHGIRYLDLHVRHYPGSKATTHAPATREDERFRKLVNVEAVREILEEIKDYIKKAPTEIIILDIHEFPPGFEEHASNHLRLVSFLHSELGDFVLPASNVSYNSTLAEVWKTGRSLIVAYNNPEIVKGFDWLWGPIPHMWAEKQSSEDLKEYLQQCIDDAKTSNKTTFWAAMAALKPTPIDFMFGGASSLRELASIVNRNLTRWFMNDWWRYTNIVTTDFFLGNGIIDTAVKACIDKANNLAQAALEEEQ